MSALWIAAKFSVPRHDAKVFYVIDDALYAGMISGWHAVDSRHGLSVQAEITRKDVNGDEVVRRVPVDQVFETGAQALVALVGT